MLVQKVKNKPRIIEAWSGPGKKDEFITIFKPEFDALHINMKERGNTEWWYFDARFESGYTAVGFFRAKHERTGKTGVEITIYKPNGEKIQHTYNYSHSDLKASVQQADIQIGRNYVKVDYSSDKFPVYEVFLDEGDFGFHLKYKALVPGWMPGKGYTQFENLGEFGWVIPLPKAAVEGTLKVHGKTIPVKGIGYHDHNWITFNPVRVVKYWYWGRIYSDNFTLIYAYIKCNKKMNDHAINVLMLAKNDEIFLSTGEFEMIIEDFQYNEKAGNNYPKTLKFKISGQNEITLNVEEVIDAENLLFEFNPILRFIAKYILRLTPGYFRLKSNFEMDMSYHGVSYKETGNTLHEMVIVKN
jgi:hypothetical protein